MLTPSPNADTDVIIPLPTFSEPNASYTLTRQHARQSNTPSDLEPDTDVFPSPRTPPPNRLYPGGGKGGAGGSQSRSPNLGAARSPEVRAKPMRIQPAGGAKSLAKGSRSASVQQEGAHIGSQLEPHIGVDMLLEFTKRELSAISSNKTNAEQLHVNASTKLDKKKAMHAASLHNSFNSKPPILSKSHSVSPKKGSPVPDPLRRGAFNVRNRSKSSTSLKPESELTRNARLRDMYTRSLSTGSNIYEILAKQREISPSHTELCLSHIPARYLVDKPVVGRTRSGDRLYTSRSLERPFSPRIISSSPPVAQMSSLPMSRGRSRDRSPARFDPKMSYSNNNNSEADFDRRSMAFLPRDFMPQQKDMPMNRHDHMFASLNGHKRAFTEPSRFSHEDSREFAREESRDFESREFSREESRDFSREEFPREEFSREFMHEEPRTFTHEEEINLIIAGEAANYLRIATPEAFPAMINAQSQESVISNEAEYEMRF